MGRKSSGRSLRRFSGRAPSSSIPSVLLRTLRTSALDAGVSAASRAIVSEAPERRGTFFIMRVLHHASRQPTHDRARSEGPPDPPPGLVWYGPATMTAKEAQGMADRA